jgi:DDE family transposase
MTARFPDKVADALRDVFTIVAEKAADESGFVQRKSKLTGEIFVQTLAFGWLRDPDATLEELAQTAANLGVSISPQGIDQRFSARAADCLLRVLEEAVTRLLTADPVAIPVLQRFPGGVCLLDSTTLTLPDALASRWAGCGGTTSHDGQAALKLFARWNLLDGTLQGPFLHAGRQADRSCEKALAPLAPGTLRLADLGFFDQNEFHALSARGVYWLSRVQPGTTIYDASGQSRSLAEILSGQTSDTVELDIGMGVHHRLPCRLLAVRVPPQVAAARRRRLRQKQVHKGRKYRSADPWLLTEWTVYVTNVPADMLSLEEALVLGRCRWQIELLWKLWKNEGHIDVSRSENPWRILCEVYAKLLGMVVQHWTLLIACWSYPDRSLTKASRTVRAMAMNLAVVLQHRHLVIKTLLLIRHVLTRGCRIAKRQKEPPTHQLLLSLPKAG